MAELVGLVASSIALVGVVTTLGESIVKLKDCWDEVRDAPDDLKWMVREIEIFSHVLVDIKADLTQESTSSVLLNNRPTMESLEMCVEATKELNLLISDLGGKLKSPGRLQRTYAAARIVMKKNQVQKYRSRLQNVTRLLSLCQQCYTRALVKAQPEIIAMKVALSISGSQRGSDSDVYTTTQSQFPIHPTRLYKSKVLPIQEDTFCSKNEKDVEVIGQTNPVEKARKNNYTWRVSLPSWMTVKALEIAGLKAPDGWKLSLRTYNVVALDSEVVRLVMQGDIRGMQELFAARKASPFDRIDGNRYTLLHYTHFARGDIKHKVYRFLLDQGADPNEGGTFRGFKLPLGSLVSHGSKRPNESLLPSIRCLMPRMDDVLYETPEETINGILSGFHGTAEEFLFVQRECCPTYYQMSHSTRVAVAGNAAAHLFDACHMPETIRVMLGEEPLNDSVLQAEFFSIYKVWASTLVHSIARKIGASLADLQLRSGKSSLIRPSFTHSCCTREQQIALYESWNALFGDIMTAAADMHRIVGFETPFCSFFTGYFDAVDFSKQGPRPRSKEDCNTALRIWLTDLQAMGLDLMEFGRIEKQIMNDEDVIKHGYGYHDTYRTFINFHYGSSPDAWHTWWSNYTDEYCGYFWDMVERDAHIMAGAWPEDIPYKM